MHRLSCIPDFLGKKYLVTLAGRQVKIPRTPGKILKIFTTTPHASTTDLIEALYGNREDGGPLTAKAIVKVQIFNLRRQLERGGIHLDLRSSPWRGYRYYGAHLIEDWSPPKAARAMKRQIEERELRVRKEKEAN